MPNLPANVSSSLERLKQVYFSDPARMVEFAEGELIVAQGGECHRVYLILEGSVVAYRSADDVAGVESPTESATRRHEVFRAQAGSYICVQCFFSGFFHSANDIYALENCKLAYIDDSTCAVDEARFGSFEHQFIPILVHELAVRNSRIFGHAAEKEEAMRLLQRAEMATTLSQLTAGIAHELNNAVGVIERRMGFVAEQLTYCLAEENPLNSKLFTLGYIDRNFASAGEIRQLARRYEREMDMPQEAAKALAHIAPTEKELKSYDKKFLRHLSKNYRFWELGHDLRDMQLASHHATGIVRSVKLLGGGKSSRQEDTDVMESIHDAMNLLSNKLKHVTVQTDFQPLPLITADCTELVQIWTNIIKNACDAMEQAGTPKPCLSIRCSLFHAEGVSLLPSDYISVAISNNGPAIPPEIHEKIFQPNFTTKKLGLDFGLGLGLSIVRRMVDSYSGMIELKSSEGNTTFTINIPTTQTQIHGND